MQYRPRHAGLRAEHGVPFEGITESDAVRPLAEDSWKRYRGQYEELLEKKAADFQHLSSSVGRAPNTWPQPPLRHADGSDRLAGEARRDITEG